jgi:endonuclease YncB( thermonuclease family)
MSHVPMIVLSLLGIAFQGQRATGNVVQVKDGSTIVVSIKGAQRPIKLAGVDASSAIHPEESTAFLRSLIQGKAVSIETVHGSSALVYRTSDSMLVNLGMVQKGFAFADPDDANLSKSDGQRFREAEGQAEKAGAGMWAGSITENPGAPGTEAPALKTGDAIPDTVRPPNAAPALKEEGKRKRNPMRPAVPDKHTS